MGDSSLVGISFVVGCKGDGDLSSLVFSIEPASLSNSFSIIDPLVRDVVGRKIITLSDGYDLISNKDIVFTMKVSDQSEEQQMFILSSVEQ